MRKYLAEVLGTYILVFAGCGAIVVNTVTGGTIGHYGVCATWGMIVTALVYAIGDFSGAHINPAVTISFWAAGRFPLKEVPAYIIAQILGACLASATLLLLFPDAGTLGGTMPAGPIMQTFVLEVIITFILMFIIIQVATGSKEVGIMAGLAIGLVVWLNATFAGPISGASMNPARSLGPAIISGNLQHQWIYVVAPILGGLLAIGTYKVLKHDQ